MKIYLDSIGCRLNQSEIEAYARQFRAAGHTLVAHAEQAELAVVNTCAVTTQADGDSRQKLRQMARAGVAQVVAAGCWVTLDPRGAAALPGVTRVVSNAEKDSLVADVLGIPAETFDLEPIEREPLPGIRQRTRAFIKVQDGCDNRCTFCVTTLVRGAGRSRPLGEVLADVRAALGGGAQEIVLTGVHLGSWGQDLVPPQPLQQLIRTILAETDTPRLRLSSLEPWDLEAAFFELWQDERLCPHLHLPLQSGSAATLRRMARKVTPESYAMLVENARRAIPEIAITTDLIVGFPGETEAEFSESLAFVHALQFAGGHVFTYSERPGTAAARLPGAVAHPQRKERNAQMRAIFTEAAAHYQTRFIGRTLSTLWESAGALGPQGWEMSGISGNGLRVTALSPHPLWNQISRVRITGPANPASVAQGVHGELLAG